MRVAGIGFRGAATVASLKDALERAGGGAELLATATSVKAEAAGGAGTLAVQRLGLGHLRFRARGAGGGSRC